VSASGGVLGKTKKRKGLAPFGGHERGKRRNRKKHKDGSQKSAEDSRGGQRFGGGGGREKYRGGADARNR